MNGFEAPEGATPLDRDEMAGLIPAHVTLRHELDRWEQRWKIFITSRGLPGVATCSPSPASCAGRISKPCARRIAMIWFRC